LKRQPVWDVRDRLISGVRIPLSDAPALVRGIFTYTFNIGTFAYNGQTDPAAQVIVELAEAHYRALTSQLLRKNQMPNGRRV
jgi:hypothetical protein